MSAPREVGVPHGHPRPLSGGAARADKGRILDEFCGTTGYHRKYALRLLNGPAARLGAAPAPAAPGHVWTGRDPGADGDLGGGGVSLVGALEGVAPAVAALGPAAARSVGDRLPAPAADQRRARSTAGSAPTKRHAPDPPLWPDQARDPAQAPHPAEDRSLGRHRAGLHRARPGGARRPSGRRRVRAFVERHRHPHDLGGDARGPRSRRGPRPDGPGGDPPGPALPPARDRLRQRLGVHQRPPLPVLPGAGDPVHARPPLQEGRQRPHRAEELDPRPEARRLLALRHAGGRGRAQRAVSARAPPLPEPVLALGQAARQGTRRGARPAPLRSRAHPPRAGAGAAPRPIPGPSPPLRACAISSIPSPSPRRSTARSSGSSPSPRRRAPPRPRATGPLARSSCRPRRRPARAARPG